VQQRHADLLLSPLLLPLGDGRHHQQQQQQEEDGVAAGAAAAVHLQQCRCCRCRTYGYLPLQAALVVHLLLHPCDLLLLLLLLLLVVVLSLQPLPLFLLQLAGWTPPPHSQPWQRSQ
jgi:hypothetical protein